MPRLPFLLQWNVSPEGHEWFDGPGVDGDRISPRSSRFLLPREKSRNMVWPSYDPLRETGLFRQLGDLPINENAIIGFADRYGLLTQGDAVLAKGGSPVLSVLKHTGKQIPVRAGDLLTRWINNIRSMKVCLALWEHARAGRRKYLNAVVKVVPRFEVVGFVSALVRFAPSGVLLPARDYEIKPTRATILATVRNQWVPLGEPGLLAIAKSSTPVAPPPSFYAGECYPFPMARDAEHPSDLVGFGVTFPKGNIPENDILRLTKALVTTEISRNLGGIRPVIVGQAKLAWGELRFVPATLEQCLWLQFAEAVCGDKEFRECLVCHKPFEISPDVARTNRLLCSATCKVRAYRRRKKQSVRLWERGYTVEQISEEVGSDAAKVRKWLAQRMAAQKLPVAEIAKTLGISVSEVTKLLNKPKGKNDGA